GSSPEGGNLLASRLSTSSSIQVEGSDLGMEQTNGYEGYASSPTREQRFKSDLVLHQTYKSYDMQHSSLVLEFLSAFLFVMHTS
ncbi:unnamed protein product, partial [Sphagnum troendelagicum]